MSRQARARQVLTVMLVPGRLLCLSRRQRNATPVTGTLNSLGGGEADQRLEPFANLGGDPSQQYLSDVLTGELTTGLARLSGFLVVARSTAFTYKGKPVDVKQVGKELAVRYALEGSGQHSGDKVRVNAQLIDAESGTHLWADQFDEDRSDLLQMQDDIVARSMRSLLDPIILIPASRSTKAACAPGSRTRVVSSALLHQS